MLVKKCKNPIFITAVNFLSIRYLETVGLQLVDAVSSRDHGSLRHEGPRAEAELRPAGVALERHHERMMLSFRVTR
jgi:hypothetical protein